MSGVGYFDAGEKNTSVALNQHYLEWTEGMNRMWEKLYYFTTIGNLNDFAKVMKDYGKFKTAAKAANRDPEVTDLSNLETLRNAEARLNETFGSVYNGIKQKAIDAAHEGDTLRMRIETAKLKSYCKIFKGKGIPFSDRREILSHLSE